MVFLEMWRSKHEKTQPENQPGLPFRSSLVFLHVDAIESSGRSMVTFHCERPEVNVSTVCEVENHYFHR